MLKVNDLIELKITKLCFGGEGLGRIDNFVVFVPFTCPDDNIVCKIVEVKKSFARARLVKVLHPSANRCQPKCEVFGLCGGCDYQHIQYQKQVEYKKTILEEFIQKLNLSYELDIAFHPSPKDFYYRNRAQIRAYKNDVGFFKKGTNTIVPTKKCHLLNSTIHIGFKKIQDKKIFNELTKVEIFETNDSFDFTYNEPHGSKSGFRQVNKDVNDLLNERVLSLSMQINPKFVYDLYCGQGNFSKGLSKKLKSKFFAVDSSKKNIEVANQNNTSSIEFVCDDVVNWLANHSLKKDSLFIFDPPRIGCDKSFIQLVSQLLPPNIIYISCNPSTMVRDLGLLQNLSHSAYELAVIEGFDMFPQTSHFETLVYLKRK